MGVFCIYYDNKFFEQYQETGAYAKTYREFGMRTKSFFLDYKLVKVAAQFFGV